MHTLINKTKPTKISQQCTNDDGMVWRTKMPDNTDNILAKTKYKADIPDARIDHCSFESFGWHHSWADTIDELIKDIESFGVPYYSEHAFLNKLRTADANDKRDNRQINLYWDGCGTTITRGEYNFNNMTDYTSL